VLYPFEVSNECPVVAPGNPCPDLLDPYAMALHLKIKSLDPRRIQFK